MDRMNRDDLIIILKLAVHIAKADDDVSLLEKKIVGQLVDKIGLAGEERAGIAVLGEEPDAETKASLTDVGITVVTAGRNGRVAGDLLLAGLAEVGHNVVFSAAGPQVFHMLVPVLDALYVTLAGRLLGGRSFSTLLEGDELEVPPSFDLGSAYLDTQGPAGAVQLFLEFQRQRED